MKKIFITSMMIGLVSIFACNNTSNENADVKEEGQQIEDVLQKEEPETVTDSTISIEDTTVVDTLTE